MALPRRAQARWPRSASTPVENPLEFGIVITREDGSIERFLEKPTWGQVFSDTINTGIFVLEPEIFDYIAPDAIGRLQLRGVSPAARRRASRCSARSSRATGRTWARSRPTVRAHKDVLDGRVEVEIPGFEISDGVYVGEGAEIHPDCPHRGAGRSSATTAGSRPTPASASTRCSAPTCASGPAPTSQRAVIHDNTYIGENVRLRGTTVGRSCDLRNGVRAEEGVVLGDECFVGEQAVLSAGVKVYPFKTVEGGRGHQQLDRVGVAGLAQPVRAARRVGAGQRRRDARAGHPGGDGVRHDAQEGRHGHHVARLEPVGPNAQAGDDGRAQRRRRERARPRGGVDAGHPLRGGPPRDRRRHQHPPRRRTTRSRSSSGSSTPRAPTSPRAPSARSSGCSCARTSAGCSPARSATSASRRATSSCTARPSRPRSTSRSSPSAGFKVVVDYSYGSTSFVMPNILVQARRRRAGGEPVRLDPGASCPGTATSTRPAWPASSGPQGRRSGR